MRYLTSGDIHRIFKQEDSGTIIRRNNVRRIALQNGIKHTISQNIILIDSKDFFEKVNPYNLEVHEYSIPKLCHHLSFLLNVITAWHIKPNTREKQPPPNSDAPHPAPDIVIKPPTKKIPMPRNIPTP